MNLFQIVCNNHNTSTDIDLNSNTNIQFVPLVEFIYIGHRVKKILTFLRRLYINKIILYKYINIIF